MICIGIITAPHGVKGQVKVKYFGEKPISDYGDISSDCGDLDCVQTGVLNNGFIIMSIAGVTEIDRAKEFKGCKLYIKRENLEKLADDTFYYHDLIGYRVITEDNKDIGKVFSLHNFGSSDILEVHGKCNIMLSFTKEICYDFDHDKRIIYVRLPEFV